jgi:hypothetical protein
MDSLTTSRRLVGKVALVTGGSSGRGLATVRRVVAEGASVMTTARNEVRARSALADLDARRAVFHHADVTEEPAVAGRAEGRPGRARPGHRPQRSSSSGTGGTRLIGLGAPRTAHRTVRAVGQSPIVSSRRLNAVAGSERAALIVDTS